MAIWIKNIWSRLLRHCKKQNNIWKTYCYEKKNYFGNSRNCGGGRLSAFGAAGIFEKPWYLLCNYRAWACRQNFNWWSNQRSMRELLFALKNKRKIFSYPDTGCRGIFFTLIFKLWPVTRWITRVFYKKIKKSTKYDNYIGNKVI